MITTSNSKIHIFPFNKANLGFETQTFDSNSIENQLTKEDIASFFDELYKRVDNFESMRRSWIQVLLYVAYYLLDLSLFAIGIFILNWNITYLHGPNYPLIYTGLFCVIFSLVIYFYGIYRIALDQKNSQTRLLILLKVFVYEVNIMLFETNLFWNLPDEHFKWIELHYEMNPIKSEERSQTEEMVAFYTPPEIPLISN